MEKKKPQRNQYFSGNTSIDGIYRPVTNKKLQINTQPVRQEHTISHFSSTNNQRRDLDTSVSQTNEHEVRPWRSPRIQENTLISSALPPSNSFSRKSQQPVKPKSKFKKAIKPTAISLGVLVLVFGIWFGSNILGSINKIFHGNVFSDTKALFSNTPLKESNGRVNILLAGNSVGDPGHQGAALADSIMVISYDPVSKKGFMLSIPRDLRVYIPSMGYQKINAAMDATNFHKAGFPSGGMGQLQEIVENDLGIPIDYEALINYAAFRDAVNAVGGITVNIKSPDPRGIYDAFTHLRLPNGEDKLNGQQALDLARARGDNVAGDVSYGLPNSDFDRTMHQRQMLKALFKKAMTLGVLSNPIKIANLFSSFSNNIQTNLSLGDVLSLKGLANGLSLSGLQSTTYSFGGSNALLTDYVSSSGQDDLVPAAGKNDFSQLKQYYQKLASNNPVKQEGATVTILNASNVSGLAAREKSVLSSQGFDVTYIGDAIGNYSSSMIVDNSNGSMPAAKTELEKDIRGQVVPPTNGSQEASEAVNYSSNFTIIMGRDWDSTKPTGIPVQN